MLVGKISGEIRAYMDAKLMDGSLPEWLDETEFLEHTPAQ